MGKRYGGIIAGAIAGMFSEVGKGMSEIGAAEAKTKTEMTLMEARDKYQKERDRSLAEITAARDEKVHGYAMTRQQDDQLARGVEAEAGRSATSTENVLNREHQTGLESGRQAHAAKLQGQQIGAADRRQDKSDTRADDRDQARLERELESKKIGMEEVHSFFRDKNGNTVAVLKDASEVVLSGDYTGKVGAKNGEQLSTQEEIRVNKAIVTIQDRATSADAKAQAKEVIKFYKPELYQQMFGNSTSSTISPRKVAGQTVNPDDYVKGILGR